MHVAVTLRLDGQSSIPTPLLKEKHIFGEKVGKQKYDSADMCIFLRIIVLVVTVEHGHGELFQEN